MKRVLVEFCNSSFSVCKLVYNAVNVNIQIKIYKNTGQVWGSLDPVGPWHLFSLVQWCYATGIVGQSGEKFTMSVAAAFSANALVH